MLASPTMALVIREMRDYDARAFLEVHHAAVRRLAARDYPAEIIEAWAPLPITSDAVEAVTANPENEIRFVADSDDLLIGLACLVMANNELRVYYVAPDVARTGVGKALLMRIEETARNAGIKFLLTDSSLTAEPFYRSQGYKVTEYGNHLLNGRWSMACVKMRKTL